MLSHKIVMSLKKFLLSKYYDIEISHRNKLLSLFHINVCCLNENFDDLQHLLSWTKIFFDIIAISETRITKQACSLNNLNLNDHSSELFWITILLN